MSAIIIYEPQECDDPSLPPAIYFTVNGLAIEIPLVCSYSSQSTALLSATIIKDYDFFIGWNDLLLL